MKKIYGLLVTCCLSYSVSHAQLVVSTLAGNGQPGLTGNSIANAQFNRPIGMTEDSQGNFYIVENDNNLIRKITSTGTVSIFAGNGTPGNLDGQGTNARFDNPWGIAIGAGDTLYVTDSWNHRVCKISPSGYVTTIAGSGSLGSANGPALQATFNYPYGISVAPTGDIFVVDRYNQLIRKISGGIVSTLAGTGSIGYQDGPGNQATFNQPQDCELDSLGNLYVADRDNYVIRKIMPNGAVSTYAGSGLPGSLDGNHTTSRFGVPTGLTMDPWGNLYVADQYSDAVRVILSNRQVFTIAGGNGSGMVDGPAAQAQFNALHGFHYSKLNPDTLYIADGFNNAIRVLNFNASAYVVFSTMLNQPTMLTADQSFEVFPNPSVGQFEIKLNEGLNGNATMELRDLQGRTIWTRNEYFNSSKLSVNLGNLPAGIYQMSIRSDKYLQSRQIVLH